MAASLREKYPNLDVDTVHDGLIFGICMQKGYALPCDDKLRSYKYSVVVNAAYR